MPTDDKDIKDKASLSYDLLDEVLHSRIRLAVVSALAGVEEAEFTWLRETVGASDGNLASHLRKLEDTGYVTMRKTFIGRKPATYYCLSTVGKEALKNYIKNLTKFIRL